MARAAKFGKGRDLSLLVMGQVAPSREKAQAPPFLPAAYFAEFGFAKFGARVQIVPVKVPDVKPVLWSTRRSNVKLPVAPLKRPVPSAMIPSSIM